MRHIALQLLVILMFMAPAMAGEEHSVNMHGMLGLNTIPSARMDDAGTVRLGASTVDPYIHSFLGFQIAEPLYVSLRQTGEVSSIDEEAKALYPGMDLKLQLLKEGEYTPQVALGLQSAYGHKRQAGEYIAASKRWGDFDFTGGVGWGRYGMAGHLSNPLKAVAKHFGKQRSFVNENPNTHDHWFTGENVGFFGGLEYFTPVEGLSFKLDYGSDTYDIEKRVDGFKLSSPWAAGINYSPPRFDFANLQLGVQGGDKVMARLSFHGNAGKIPFKSYRDTTPQYFRPFRTKEAYPGAALMDAQGQNIALYDAKMRERTMSAKLSLDPNWPAPMQLGRAVRALSNESGSDIEKIEISTEMNALKGPKITFIRKDFERALTNNHGSPEEIWQNAEISEPDLKSQQAGAGSVKRAALKSFALKLILDNQISLAEEDHGALYRSDVLADISGPEFFGLLHTGARLRFRIKDNLDKLDRTRVQRVQPVRSNVDDFTDDFLSIDKLYLGWMQSLEPDIHVAVTAGYLEEMYGGLGGEVLYRPYGSRFALGGELWGVTKRNPDYGYENYGTVTGHVNGWYELPEQDLTLHAKVGRYLGEDIGATFEITRDFMNGAKLSGYATVTNGADADAFGGFSNIQHGVKLSIPLGSTKYMPEGSEVRTRFEPFAKDYGQAIHKPTNLYDQTTPLSGSHLAKYWHQMLD